MQINLKRGGERKAQEENWGLLGKFTSQYDQTSLKDSAFPELLPTIAQLIFIDWTYLALAKPRLLHTLDYPWLV